MMADLPAFTGLGSSSTFTVCLLHALHTFKGQFLKPQELACEAIHVERQILKENVGCQDQVLAAFGGFNLVEFRTEQRLFVNRVPLPPHRLAEFERHLFLVFTGIQRKASDVVAPQLRRVAEHARSCAPCAPWSMRDMISSPASGPARVRRTAAPGLGGQAQPGRRHLQPGDRRDV